MDIDIDIRKTLRAGQRSFHLEVRIRAECQRMVIFGPSGAGKSLLLKAIAGLMTPEQGRIRLGDTVFFDVQAGIDLAPQARRVGYLFQDYALFPHLTVRQNIGFGLCRGWRNPGAKRRLEAVDYWLDAFQLAHLAHQHPGELSGGQKQRTALARALVASPRALLLDEPFAALDAELRVRMRQELDELQPRLGVPMILITHDPADVQAFGDRVITLREGSVVPPEAVTQAAAPMASG